MYMYKEILHLFNLHLTVMKMKYCMCVNVLSLLIMDSFFVKKKVSL